MTSGGLTEISIWYRGITEGKISRDVASSLAQAATKEGKYTQAFDNYVDLPDRIYVPCRSYARIADQPIAEPYLYENDHPAIVVLIEPTMIKGVPVLKGVPAGGILVVNTDREPADLLKHLGDPGPLAVIATIHAGGGALEGALTGIEGALDVTGVGGGAAGPLAGAVARVSGIVGLASLASVVKDPAGVQRGWDEVKVFRLPSPRPEPVEEPREAAGELSLIVPAPTTENEGMITGNWRFLRPVIDQEKCTQCRICWIYCPDNCIQESAAGYGVNLKYCKGCGICWTECPAGAIRAEPELDFAGGVVRF